jgi:hypothetical protein
MVTQVAAAARRMYLQLRHYCPPALAAPLAARTLAPATESQTSLAARWDYRRVPAAAADRTAAAGQEAGTYQARHHPRRTAEAAVAAAVVAGSRRRRRQPASWRPYLGIARERELRTDRRTGCSQGHCRRYYHSCCAAASRWATAAAFQGSCRLACHLDRRQPVAEHYLASWASERTRLGYAADRWATHNSPQSPP